MSQKHRRLLLCTGESVLDDECETFPGSHIVGEMLYVMDEGRKITALARWEISFGVSASLPIKPDIDSYIIGDARNIKCRFSGCRHVVRWETGQAAFMILMARYGNNHYEGIMSARE